MRSRLGELFGRTQEVDPPAGGSPEPCDTSFTGGEESTLETRGGLAQEQGLFHGSIWFEKRKGLGEDAQPLLMAVGDTGGFLLGVFDGLGGAGSTSYDLPGSAHTGAYLASRLARRVVSEVVNASKLSSLGDDSALSLRSLLEDELKTAMASESAKLPEQSTVLRSSIIRVLPTTLAAIYCPTSQGTGDVPAIAAWAGDSRVYRLSPRAGLQQISRDHVRGGDAYEDLQADSPMTNVVSASEPFTIETFVSSGEKPHILLVATDGCFSYFSTPWHFEHMLLRTLSESTSPSDWMRILGSEIRRVAADDASSCFVAVGWTDFAVLREAFLDRMHLISRVYVSEFDRARRKVTEARERRQAADHALAEAQATQDEIGRRTWADYSRAYNAAAPGRTSEEDECIDAP